MANAPSGPASGGAARHWAAHSISPPRSTPTQIAPAGHAPDGFVGASAQNSPDVPTVPMSNNVTGPAMNPGLQAAIESKRAYKKK